MFTHLGKLCSCRKLGLARGRFHLPGDDFPKTSLFVHQWAWFRLLRAETAEPGPNSLPNSTKASGAGCMPGGSWHFWLSGGFVPLGGKLLSASLRRHQEAADAQ